MTTEEERWTERQRKIDAKMKEMRQEFDLYRVHPAHRKPSQGPSKVHGSFDGKRTLCGIYITTTWEKAGFNMNCERCKSVEKRWES